MLCRNSICYLLRVLSYYKMDLSSANKLLSFFTEKEVNGLMEELFETVSSDFGVSRLVEFCS